MKKLIILVCSIGFVLFGCTKNELTREEALTLIQQSKQYPKVVDYEIFRGDPKYARKVLDAGLETAGLVTVQRRQTLSELGNPLITFTNKAQPYLLPTPKEDKSHNIQRVKLADEELQEITGIKLINDGESAVVKYTTSYKNVTPFSKLVHTDFESEATREAYFSLYDDGWRLEKDL